MGGYYYEGARKKKRAQHLDSASPSEEQRVDRVPEQGWLPWLQARFAAGSSHLYRSLVQPGSAPVQYQVLRRIAKELLYRLLAAVFGKVVNAAIMPGVGTLLQVLEEDRRQRRENQAGSFERVRAAVQHFVQLPSGNENEQVLSELQNLVKWVLPGLDLLDDYRQGEFTLERFDQRLVELLPALQTPELIKVTNGASLTLVNAVDCLRMFCRDVVDFRQHPERTRSPEQWVGQAANSGFMRAMMPAELHWFVDTIAELAVIAGNFRPVAAGQGDWRDKGFKLLEIVLRSRLGHLLLPRLETLLQSATQWLFDETDDDEPEQRSIEPSSRVERLSSVLEWFAQDRPRDWLEGGWAPSWLTDLFGYLDRLATGSRLLLAAGEFPAKPVEQLAWGIELLQQNEFRRLLEHLFTSNAVANLLLPFDVFETARPLAAGSSHEARARWASQLVEREDITRFFSTNGMAEDIAGEGLRSLRETLEWAPIMARLSQVQSRLDQSAGYLECGRALFMELGALLFEQVSLPSLTSTARLGKNLAFFSGDVQGAAVLGAYIAIREMDTQGGYASGVGQLTDYVQENLEALTGHEQPQFRKYGWLFNAARQGVAIAGRWWNASASSEVQSGLESIIRLIKIVFDLSPQTHAALDAIPLLPHVLEAFNESSEQDTGASAARLDRFAQALQNSANPAIRRLGTQAERWVINSLADAIGSLLPQHSSLADSLPVASASALDNSDLSVLVAMQQADRSLASSGTGGWSSEQIFMGGHVLSFTTLMSILYGGYSFQQNREKEYAQVHTDGDLESQPVTEEPPGVLRRYRTTGLALAGALVAASLAAGTYTWAERRRQQELAQTAANEPLTPIVPGAHITLLQGVEAYLKDASGDMEVLTQPSEVTRLLHELLDDSASEPDIDGKRHARIRIRRDTGNVEKPLPYVAPERLGDKVRSLAGGPHLLRGLIDDSGSEADIDGERDARIRVQRDTGNVEKIMPFATSEQLGDEVRSLAAPPEEAVPQLAYEVAVGQYQDKHIREAIGWYAGASAELPPHLTSIESFAEKAGGEIKREHYFRPPFFTGSERVDIKFKSYEQNPLLWFTSPITQPYVTAHTYFSPNDEKTLPNERPFYRRFLFNMQGDIELPAADLITGQLKSTIGENTYAVEARDPLQQQYLEALTQSSVVRDYETEVGKHIADHLPQMQARLVQRIYKHLDRAVGRDDYVPRERLAERAATLRPVHAQYVEKSPSADERYSGPEEHPLLDTFRYVDLAERIDIVVFMTTGAVHDAYDPTRSTDKQANSDDNRATGHPTRVARLEMLVEVLRNTANMTTDIFNAIARHISTEDLEYARMLRDQRTGRLVYAPEFINRVAALQPYSLIYPHEYPGPIELKSEPGMAIDDFARWQLTVLQRDLLHRADARSVSPEEQETAFWTHKLEFVGNLIATGLTILGAAPIAGATQFARAAWLAAVTSASISAMRYTGTAETAAERDDIFKRWLMTLATETFFWTLGEFAVDSLANRMIPPKLPGNRPKTFGQADFLANNPSFDTPAFTDRLHDSFGIFSAGNRPVHALRAEAFRTKVRDHIKTVMNQGLLNSALHLSPHIQAVFDKTDFNLIGTPQMVGKEFPPQAREPHSASPGSGRYLPRDTLPPVTERARSGDWVIDENGLPGIATPMVYADDSDENQWGLTYDLDPKMPGRYRYVDKLTYRYLGADPAKFYGNQKVRLVRKNDTWEAIPIVLDQAQIEAAKKAWDAQQARTTTTTTLRPGVERPGQPMEQWVVKADETGALQVSQPANLTLGPGPDRWKAHDNDDPREPGIFRRLGKPPTFNYGKTYQYLGELDDRSQDNLFSLVETDGRWSVISAPLPDRSYNFIDDSNKLLAYGDKFNTGLVELKKNLKQLDSMNPNRSTWLDKVNEMRTSITQMGFTRSLATAAADRLRSFAKTQLKADEPMKLVETQESLGEQRQREVEQISTALQTKMDRRGALKDEWNRKANDDLRKTRSERQEMRREEQKILNEIKKKSKPPRGASPGSRPYLDWRRFHDSMKKSLEDNRRRQRLNELRQDEIRQRMT